jgi:hypothetical protein
MQSWFRRNKRTSPPEHHNRQVETLVVLVWRVGSDHRALYEVVLKVRDAKESNLTGQQVSKQPNW